MSPFRVIFLDIDGVLNSRAWFAGREQKGTLGELDPEAVARVQRLVDDTGASIVISSTWRLIHKKLVLQSMFTRKGLRKAISGVTPSLPDKDRGHEIQRWLDCANLLPEAQRPASIVILDDDSDMAHLAPWHVKTHFDRGLTDWEVARAKEVLMRPAPPVQRTPHPQTREGKP